MKKQTKIIAMSSIAAGLGVIAIPAVSFATSTSGNVRLDTEISASIAMKIQSPNDTNPDCTVQSGVTYGVANRYASSTGDDSSKIVDTFNGNEGEKDEINTNTSCATLSMAPNTFESTYSDVTVYTNSSLGYGLTVRSADNTSPDLVNIADNTEFIPAGALTENNGEVPGGQNKWAIKGNVGALDTWTAVTTEDQSVRSYDTLTEGGSTTRVTYGISSGYNPAGKYATTLTYTAVMFDGSSPSNSPALNIVSGDPTPDPVDPAPNPPTPPRFEVTPTSLTIPYGETKTITITPQTGYYISGVTCSNGYTCTGENGAPLVFGPTITGPITIYVTNNSENGDGVITVTTAPIEYPVSLEGDEDNESNSMTLSAVSLSIPYGGSKTVTFTPNMGYYLDGVSCAEGYSCEANDLTGNVPDPRDQDPFAGIFYENVSAAGGNAILTGEEAIDTQDIKVTNEHTTKGGSVAFATNPRNFTIDIASPDNLTTDAESLRVPYGHSKSVTVTPAAGSYLSSVDCPEGYTCTKTDGTEITTGTEATDEQTILVANGRTISGGTLAFSTNANEYTVSIAKSNISTGANSLSIPYGESRTVTVTPNTGYYLSNVSCPSGYTCTKSDGTAISTGTSATSSQTVKVTNNNATSGGTLTFTGSKRSFTLSISASDITTSPSNSTSILYGSSRDITVTPSAGHYLSSVSCPSGYTCTKTDGTAISTGTSATSSQTIRVTNSNTTSGGTLTLSAGTSNYTVSVSNSNTTVSSYSLNIPYGGSKTVDVTPNSNYYLSSVSCPSGYTCSGYSTGSSYTGKQTITVKNNSTTSGGTLYVTSTIKSYQAAITPSVNATVSTNSLSIPYGGSRTFTITPNAGYYLTGVTCSSGYTCSGYTTGSASDPNSTSRGAQTITVKNNSSTNAGAISFTLDNKYRISFSKTNISSPSSSYVDVAYGGSTTVTVTPASGYYLSAFSGCPSGWTCSGVSTGTSYTGAQTLTLKNNSSVNTGTLAFAATKLADYMQDFSAAAHSTDAAGTTYTLTDSRDEKQYIATKLADGKIWMTQDLKLDGGRTLTSADSDVSSNFALAAENTGTWCTSADAACYNQSLMRKTGAPNGYFYNWYAATAGSGTYSTTANATASICPKGWKLPTKDQYVALDVAYGGSGSNRTGDTTQVNKFLASPLNFNYTGYVNGGSVNSPSDSAYYWSRTANSETLAYDLRFHSNGNFYPQHRSLKYNGYAVRCVAAS